MVTYKKRGERKLSNILKHGRPVVAYVSSEYRQYNDFPLKDVNTVDQIVNTIKSMSLKLWKAEYNYLSKYHAPEGVVKRMSNIYVRLLSV